MDAKVKDAIARIDSSLVPGSGVTKVTISRDLCGLDEEGVSEVVSHYRQMGYVVDGRLKGATFIDFVLESADIR